MSRARITTEWTPHDGQLDVLQSDARFRVVACGRRWGKTEMSGHEAARYLGEPGTLVWWVAPTYDIADIGFEAVREALPETVVEETKYSKPKGLTLVNGSEVSFRSADREDSLRGEGLDLLVIDEAAMVPERAWTDELRPTLSDTLGDMIAISTPKGRGWFYQWWQRGQNPDQPETRSWQAPTYENPHVPDSEIDDARSEVPERVFRQEYLAEFVSETGGVFEGLESNLFTLDWSLPEHGLPPKPDSVTIEQIEQGEVDQRYAVPPYSTGVDIARHEDYRVIVTLDSWGRIVYFDRERHEAWPQIQQAVERAVNRYPGVAVVDASRDNKLVADLEAAGVRVDPVKFTQTRKQSLIENLSATIEAGDLSAPDIPILQHELEVFEYDVTRAGNVRYHAPEGFHDDTVDALALAVEGLDQAAAAPTATARVGQDDGPEDASDGLDNYVKRQAQRQHKARKGWK